MVDLPLVTLLCFSWNQVLDIQGGFGRCDRAINILMTKLLGKSWNLSQFLYGLMMNKIPFMKMLMKLMKVCKRTFKTLI